jgi:predicted nucleic acid-binding Zn ribbon protein
MARAEHIGSILDKVIRSLDLEQGMKEHRAVLCWDDVVGERVARVTRAVAIKKGVLFVEAKNSAWMHELVFLKPMILDRLNEQLGSKAVVDIVFCQAREPEAGREVNGV